MVVVLFTVFFNVITDVRLMVLAVTLSQVLALVGML